MRCRKYKSEIEKSSKFFQKREIKEKHVYSRVIIVLVAIVMIAGSVGAAGCGRIHEITNKGNEVTAHSTQNDTVYAAFSDAANKTTASGSWTETMNASCNMVLNNNNSSVKTKATMDSSMDIEGWNGKDTSSLHIVGSANYSVLNQNIAWTMTWQNGMAHYEYTEPAVNSVDLKIEPSYFYFDALTEDMILSSSMYENQLSFTVKGDDLTRVGMAIVQDFLSSTADLKYDVKYDDATFEVTINEQTGRIDKMIASFHASMAYQGYDAEADWEIHYNFSEHM